MIVPGEGKEDHPIYQLAQAVKTQLERIGITLEIVDPENSDDLWNALNAGSAELMGCRGKRYGRS